MNRKEALKIFATIGISAFIPFGFSSFFKENKTKYIVGFGGVGANLLSENIDVLKGETIVVNNTLYDNTSLFIETPNYRQELSMQDFASKITLPKQLKKLFLDKNNFVLIAGLGGATGTHLLYKSAKFLKEKNKDFTIICSLPFTFEGKRRNVFARNIFKDLQEIQKPKLIELDNIYLQKGDMTIVKAFKIVDKQILSLVG